MGEAVREAAVREAPERAPAPPTPPRRPRRPRRGRTHRSKQRRGYQDKMVRPADYADKSQGWDTYGSAPA